MASARNESAVTVRDVAQLAGVSPGTVSKALNGQGQLREETRQRVQEAADKLRFRPNQVARSLAEGRTYTVGMLTSDSFGRFTLPLMEGIEDSLGAGKVSTLLCDGRGDPLRERHYLAELLNRRVDGIVVTGRRPDARRSVGQLPIPVVYVLGRSDDPGDLSVTNDDEQGARLAVEHLVAHGRTRLAYVSGPAHHLSTQLRQQGFEAAAAAAGVEVADVLLGRWSEAWGRTAAQMLARRTGGAVDAVFCGSDQIARGLTDGLREAGVRVPVEVSVVGFDNWDVMAEAARPPLTTIDPRLVRLGRESASRLLAAIDGAELGQGVVAQPCELVIRESSVPT
ncbi:LacI family DNA-binding transcriptional regulator [Microlunatus flavus]|uniref:LacI family transcriptional regulator n=1 Tax=Microlunatus flavus TaxID=1036181 RepID=A0A1H9AE65_9ACTN|nr:LacI family DNA-binding transcriptional regulator [Microlunatus flavus]SEP74258.1 LacI family transcriptional regulator [Microlunatus flavus]